jgi:hypothetical protein
MLDTSVLHCTSGKTQNGITATGYVKHLRATSGKTQNGITATGYVKPQGLPRATRDPSGTRNGQLLGPLRAPKIYRSSGLPCPYPPVRLSKTAIHTFTRLCTPTLSLLEQDLSLFSVIALRYLPPVPSIFLDTPVSITLYRLPLPIYSPPLPPIYPPSLPLHGPP